MIAYDSSRPFDHPELCVPIGGDTTQTSPIRAFAEHGRQVGGDSRRHEGNLVPLQTFDELLRGNDGSRIYTLRTRAPFPAGGLKGNIIR
jgi:hypothetical protein